MAKGKLHTGPKGGKYRIKNGKKVYEKKEAKKKAAPRKARVAKIHVGKKGGEYYMKKGKRVYLEVETPALRRPKAAAASVRSPVALGSMKAMPGWWGAPAVAASYKKPVMPASMKKPERRHTVGA